jgi:aspartate/glutamate racemase
MVQCRARYHRQGGFFLSGAVDVMADLRSILGKGEKIPAEVRRCAKKLAGYGIWVRFSRNDPVKSCQDAARRRERLGHKGIPLWDELKSFLGEYDDRSGRRQTFLAHCRGDRELDMAQVRSSLQFAGEIRRVVIESDSSDIRYGTVNPFIASGAVIQLFDYELQTPVGVPGTVMTNAGDHTWAVEFDPAELVTKLPGARWADIIKPYTKVQGETFWGVRERETIGILTGNPCDSGLELCAAINKRIRDLLGGNSLGDVSMPKIVFVSSPEIGTSMEMDRREAQLRGALIKAVDELCAAGARIIAHPAHTTHYFASDIAERAREKGARFISMVDATVAHLRSTRTKKIALLGTRYVTDFSLPWSVYKGVFKGIKVHTPSAAGWKKIHDLGYEVQQRGPTSVCFNWMRDLLRDEVPDGWQDVVLAMTEFSPVTQHLKTRGRQGKNLINPIEIYGDVVAREYLGLRQRDRRRR